jgi:hypothetical protein
MQKLCQAFLFRERAIPYTFITEKMSASEQSLFVSEHCIDQYTPNMVFLQDSRCE